LEPGNSKKTPNKERFARALDAHWMRLDALWERKEADLPRGDEIPRGRLLEPEEDATHGVLVLLLRQ
jgi:hypothetical protein